MKNRDFTGGIIVIVIGLIFLISNLGIANFSLGTYWPLLLIIFGITRIFRGTIQGGMTFIFWGTLFQICEIYGWNLFGTLWPLIIIWFGLLALFKPDQWDVKKSKSAQDYIDKTSIFEGSEFQIDSKTFKGGKIDTVFGGTKIDLRDTKLPKSGADLEINAIFGGVEVFVSNNYQIVSDGVAVFGGWVNKFKTANKKLPVLRIKGAAVFGGVEIKE